MKQKTGDNLGKILWNEKKIIKKERKQKGWKKKKEVYTWTKNS